MYSLPITTYSDYWRATKTWSSYLGGLVVFAASTRYSTLGGSDMTQTMQMPFHLTIQSLNKKMVDTKVELLDSRQRASNKSTVSRGMLFLQEELNHEVISQEVEKKEVLSQRLVSQEVLKKVIESRGLLSRELISRGVPSRGLPSREVSSQGFGDRVTSRTEVKDKEIPFDTQYVESDKLSPGMSQIQEKGEKGISRQVVKTFEVGGQPVDQQIQSSFEIKSPKKEVILRNSKPVPKKKVIIKNSKPAEKESIELDKRNISKKMIVEATAYTYTGNKTATGVNPREGLIAVDPKVIAMGSKVYVEGYGYAIAADTGGDIRGNRIDVFFSTLRQCIDWGRKPVNIYVINPI